MEASRGRPRQRLTKFRRLELTPEKFTWLWEQLTSPKLIARTLSDDVRGPDELLDALKDPHKIHLEAYEGDKIVGWAMWAGINDWSAVAHLTFFDQRLRGREYAVRELIRYFMAEEFDWQVVHAFLPETHRASIAWVQRIGFRVHGRQRRSLRRGGKLLDYVVLSITREEAFADGGVDGTRRKPADFSGPAADALSTAVGGVPSARPVPDEPDEPRPGLLRRLSAARKQGAAVPRDADLGG